MGAAPTCIGVPAKLGCLQPLPQALHHCPAPRLAPCWHEVLPGSGARDASWLLCAAGYLAGAVLAVVVAEWLIHLPLFDILLGFPVQVWVAAICAPMSAASRSRHARRMRVWCGDCGLRRPSLPPLLGWAGLTSCLPDAYCLHLWGLTRSLWAC